MFSFVQSIASVLNPYQASAVDARLDRKRHADPDEQEHNDARDDAPAPLQVVGDEGTVLSVQSLILFLEDFLESQIGPGFQKEEEPALSWVHSGHSNMNEEPVRDVGRAARAYEKTAKTALRRRVFKVAPPKRGDLSHLYRMIKDLRDLKANGVTDLNLDSKLGFIDSIAHAVEVSKRG